MIGNSGEVMRMATGEETDEANGDGKDSAAKALEIMLCADDPSERAGY